jgi:hypothetical protein
MLIVICFFGSWTRLTAEEGGKARTFIVKLEHLELTAKSWKAGDPAVKNSMKLLISLANSALKRGPYSVTKKKYTPPSGDKHDFLSYGAYYWPNPKTEDGLPWVMKDGYNNPDASLDWKQVKPMSVAVEILALAYYFTGREDYAAHAALLLRTWFIDKDTRMNPNVNYGKVIPGVREKGYSVAGFGYIFRRIYDAAGILERSPAWTKKDKKALRQWTADFIKWLDTSPYGREEQCARNNHGTFFDMTMALQCLYINDEERAEKTLRHFIEKRIPKQMAPDGSQPFEMKRVNNYDYHCFNLLIAFDIAQMADRFDALDAWTFKTPKGAGLRKAMEFLTPYLSGQKKWPYFTSNTFEVSSYLRWTLMRRAALGFADPGFEKAPMPNPKSKRFAIIDLTYPAPALFPGKNKR